VDDRHQLLLVLIHRANQKGVGITFEEIMKNLPGMVSMGTTYNFVKQLTEDGYIYPRKGKHRSIRLTPKGENFLKEIHIA
jgi:predicted transcriptional regulator